MYKWLIQANKQAHRYKIPRVTISYAENEHKWTYKRVQIYIYISM